MPSVKGRRPVVAVSRSPGRTPSQIGLAWLLHHTPNILLIPGTANTEHLRVNVSAGALALDDATLAALDAVPTRSGDIALG
jgi:aryl-alcohol dehydrogenase-like predicted oxidoreductase